MEAIAFTKMITIFRGEVKQEFPYNSYDVIKKRDKVIKRIKEEGIYLFGGRLKNGKASNKLYVLKIGSKPLKWISPETAGTPPIARYSHSMNYYHELNILIIYGGRNDNLKYKPINILTPESPKM